jgi:hypothetical protein
MSQSEFEDEPVRGLPKRLPEGETILWQGSPEAGLAMRRIFHLPWVAGYFAVLVAWKLQRALSEGADLAHAALEAGTLAVIGSVALGLLAAIGWGIARTTIYTLTSKRLIVRFGVALRMSVTVPYTKIDGAAIRRSKDGSGDLSLTLSRSVRVSYLILWPHVRPWRFLYPQPSLRALRNPDVPAGILARAMEADAPGQIRLGAVDEVAVPATQGQREPVPANG